MKFLRKYLDNIKPSFQKGGKLSMFHSTFDAFETFLFVPNTVTTKGSHIRDSIDMKRTMSVVVFALLPCLFFGMWNAGYQHFLSVGQAVSFWETFLFGVLKVMPIVLVSYIVGLGIEFAFAQSRGHEVNEGFLVSGMLIPLIMPVDVPLWMVALATAFAVVIGKEIFGGTGMNIWNPALLARAFVFFSYPSQMSGDKVWVAGLGQSHGQGIIDGFSGATPLAEAASKAQLASELGAKAALEVTKAAEAAGTATSEIAVMAKHAAEVASSAVKLDLPSAWDMFIGIIPGSIGETSKLAILIGAIILIATGIASWRIIVSGVLGTLSFGLLMNLVAGTNPYMAMPAYYHLLIGGLAFGLVFMATDPVSAAQTNTGKWIYGFLIGVLVVIIRLFNPAYPEGAMLVILLMNTFAPLIDYYVVAANIRRRMKRNKAVATA